MNMTNLLLALLLVTGVAMGQEPETRLHTATFAGGCFWCMEPPFDELTGVISTTSGYIGGHATDSTYEEVSAGVTGHTEAVQVLYNPAVITYPQLLDVFWRNVDPVARNRQFCDSGSQYCSGVFYHDEEQERLARQSKNSLERSARFSEPIATEITEATVFYSAEEYHQNYYMKNPLRYKFYSYQCGREKRLKQLWGNIN